MSLNLSLKYSLEEGLQLSFSIVSVSTHWCRDPGTEKLDFISRNLLLRCLVIQLKARGHVRKEEAKES